MGPKSISYFAFGLVTATLIGGLTPAVASEPNQTVIFCVNKSSAVVTKKTKCGKNERTLVMALEGKQGPAGMQGEKGDKGDTGPAGPAGQSAAPFKLAEYPVLFGNIDGINKASCDTKWTLIINFVGNNNIQVDEFGQPVGNKQWALDAAGGCPYIYPEIFDNPKISSITSIVHGQRTQRAGFDKYAPPQGWTVQITSMTVDWLLDPGWHLCTIADPQYTDRGIRNTNWTQVSPKSTTFTGNAYWYAKSPSASSKAFISEGVSFCGPDASTSSGLGVRYINTEILIPLDFAAAGQ